MGDEREGASPSSTGEAAILAVSSAREQAAVVVGKLAVRSLMNDALRRPRIVDGATGTAFSNAVAETREHRLWRYWQVVGALHNCGAP